MKKYVTSCFLLLFTFLLFSCSNGEDIFYVKDNDYLNHNNIQNVVMVCSVTDVVGSTTDEILIHGIRNDNNWFAAFEKESKKMLNEWSCTLDESANLGNNIFHYSGPAYKLNNGCYVLNNDGSAIYFLGEENQAKQIYKTEGFNTLIFANEVFIVLRTSNIDYTILNINGDMLIDSARVENQYTGKFPETGRVLFSQLQEDSLTIFSLNLKGENSTYEVFKDKFNRNVQIDHGYGEIENLYINHVCIMDNYTVDKGGLCAIFCSTSSKYYWYDERLSKIYDFNANGIKAKFKIDDMFDGPYFKDWYNGSILVLNKYVVDDSFQLLYEFKEEFIPNKFYVPVSYTHIVRDSYTSESKYSIECLDLENGRIIWNSKIAKLSDFADNTTRYEYKALSHDGKSLKLHVKAVNYDASKLEFDFLVDKATGEITYL